jgi:hypothetical protein
LPDRNFDTNALQVRVARSLKKGPVKVLVKPGWVEAIVNFKDDPKISALPNPDDYLWETLDEHGNAKAEPAASCNAKTISSCKKSKFRIASPNEGERSYDRSSIAHGHGNGTSGHDPVDDSVHDAVDEQLTKTNISEVPDEPFTVEVTEEQALGKKPIDPSHCQVLSKGHIVVPVDDHCLLQDYAVYIDPRSGTAYDASLNQCNASNNNNKFYRLQVIIAPQTSVTSRILQTSQLTSRMLDPFQRRQLQDLDPLGPCWPERTRCHSRHRVPR